MENKYTKHEACSKADEDFVLRFWAICWDQHQPRYRNYQSDGNAQQQHSIAYRLIAPCKRFLLSYAGHEVWVDEVDYQMLVIGHIRPSSGIEPQHQRQWMQRGGLESVVHVELFGRVVQRMDQ